MLIKLGFLNIGRNPRRSLITVLAVGVGLAALIFLWAFSDGTSESQRENVIRLLTGHLQIHAAGFEQSIAPELFIPDKDRVRKLLESQAHLVAYSERAKCEALIGTSENSRGILLMGIHPESEIRVTEFKNHIAEGAFLENNDHRSILIGDRLAKKIKVALGDKVVIMTQALDGTLAGFSYHVKGIFKTGSQQIDEQTAYITLSSAQELLGLDNDIHEIAVRLNARKYLPDYLAGLKKSLDSSLYEVLRWDEIVPEVEQWAKWADAIVETILMAVMVVIGVSIMNTVLMSVFERTKELGVMLAIGTSPSQIMRLILIETLVLEFFGIILGLIAGYLITFYFGHVGISFHGVEEAFSMSYMSTVVYPQIELHNVLRSVITLLIMTTLIGLYPAWKAGKLQPVQAIYHS